ncbi:hypothetical protein EBR43_14085 [bacterium]|nr:hypothetical protein [bacterium]
MARVVSLFSARGYNIESLCVSQTDEVNKKSTIVIETICSKKMSSLLVKLLNRLIPVHNTVSYDVEEKSELTRRYYCLCKTVKDPSGILNVKVINTIFTPVKTYYVEISSQTYSDLDETIKLLEAFEIVKSGALMLS